MLRIIIGHSSLFRGNRWGLALLRLVLDFLFCWGLLGWVFFWPIVGPSSIFMHFLCPLSISLAIYFYRLFEGKGGHLLGLGRNKIGDGLVVLRDEISILCINLHTVFLFHIPQILLF